MLRYAVSVTAVWVYSVVVEFRAVVSSLVALVLYPVSFARELPQGNRSIWEFGWVSVAYSLICLVLFAQYGYMWLRVSFERRLTVWLGVQRFSSLVLPFCWCVTKKLRKFTTKSATSTWQKKPPPTKLSPMESLHSTNPKMLNCFFLSHLYSFFPVEFIISYPRIDTLVLCASTLLTVR